MFTTEELRILALQRPISYGSLHMQCVGCSLPSVTIKRREDGVYVVILGTDVFLYMEESQVISLVGELDTKMRAVLEEE